MKFKGFDKRNCFEIMVHATEDDSTWEQCKEIKDTPYNRELIEILLKQETEETYLSVKQKQAEALELLGFTFFFKFEHKDGEPYWYGWKCLDWNRNWIEIDSWYVEYIYYYDKNTYRYTVEKD